MVQRAAICGRERGRGPGVEHVRVAGEAAGLAALGGVVPGRRVGHGIDRQVRVPGDDRFGVARLALGVERVPDRDRHAEEPLPADQPVAVQAVHPVLVPDPHVRGMPVDLPAPGQQGLGQLRVAAAVAQVPLLAGDDLQRLAALFVEVDRVPDRLGVAEQVAGRAQQAGDPLPGRHRRLAGELPVGAAPGPAGDRRGRAGQEAPVLARHRARGQAELPPPGDVAGVAERADHRDAGALARVRQVVRQHRDLDPEQRRAHRGPEQARVALVVRPGDQRDAGREQLGAGGRHRHRPAVRGAEGDPVIGAGDLPVLHLGLGDRGAERDVPQRRRLGQVRLTAGQVAQKGALRDGPGAGADGPVHGGPVHRQAQPPPHLLERLLVQVGQPLAQLHEVAP